MLRTKGITAKSAIANEKSLQGLTYFFFLSSPLTIALATCAGFWTGKGF